MASSFEVLSAADLILEVAMDQVADGFVDTRVSPDVQMAVRSARYTGLLEDLPSHLRDDFDVAGPVAQGVMAGALGSPACLDMPAAPFDALSFCRGCLSAIAANIVDQTCRSVAIEAS